MKVADAVSTSTNDVDDTSAIFLDLTGHIKGNTIGRNGMLTLVSGFSKCLLGSHVKFAWMYMKVADAVFTPTNDVDDNLAIFLDPTAHIQGNTSGRNGIMTLVSWF